MLGPRTRQSGVPVVGVTGTRAAGKSEVLAALGRLGATTIAADQLLGDTPDTLENGHSVDDDHLRERLVDAIGRHRERLDRQESPPPLVAIEHSLLFELDLARAFDSTVTVVAPAEKLKRRALPNGNARNSSYRRPELVQGEKASRSDLVIRNDGTLVDLQVKVGDLWSRVARPRSARSADQRSRPRRWNAFVAVGAVVMAAAVTTLVLVSAGGESTQTAVLPLKYARVIESESAKRDLKPALIAAVVMKESRFDPQTVFGDAVGLMQIEPETAALVARRTGSAPPSDPAQLKNPKLNIDFGSYYLRYLNGAYDGNWVLTLAAYNAGPTQVDQWLDDASAQHGTVAKVMDIPLGSTRSYIRDVLSFQRSYEKKFADLN